MKKDKDSFQNMFIEDNPMKAYDQNLDSKMHKSSNEFYTQP